MTRRQQSDRHDLHPEDEMEPSYAAASRFKCLGLVEERGLIADYGLIKDGRPIQDLERKAVRQSATLD